MLDTSCRKRTWTASSCPPGRRRTPGSGNCPQRLRRPLYHYHTHFPRPVVDHADAEQSPPQPVGHSYRLVQLRHIFGFRSSVCVDESRPWLHGRQGPQLHRGRGSQAIWKAAAPAEERGMINSHAVEVFGVYIGSNVNGVGMIRLRDCIFQRELND